MGKREKKIAVIQEYRRVAIPYTRAMYTDVFHRN